MLPTWAWVPPQFPDKPRSRHFHRTISGCPPQRKLSQPPQKLISAHNQLLILESFQIQRPNSREPNWASFIEQINEAPIGVTLVQGIWRGSGRTKNKTIPARQTPLNLFRTNFEFLQTGLSETVNLQLPYQNQFSVTSTPIIHLKLSSQNHLFNTLRSTRPGPFVSLLRSVMRPSSTLGSILSILWMMQMQIWLPQVSVKEKLWSGDCFRSHSSGLRTKFVPSNLWWLPWIVSSESSFILFRASPDFTLGYWNCQGP